MDDLYIPELDLPDFEETSIIIEIPVIVDHVEEIEPQDHTALWIFTMFAVYVLATILIARYYSRKNRMCESCKKQDHTGCDRIMRPSVSTCRCMSPMCSSLSNEKYHSP